LLEYNKPPLVNPIPTAILVILSGIILVEVLLFFSFGGLVGRSGVAADRLFLMQHYGVPPDLANWMLETSNFSINYVSRFIFYPFINLSSLSVVFAAVLLLALGKMVGEVFSALSVFLIWFLSTTLAAFFYSMSATNGQILVGSYPGVYGFVGAYTFVSWITSRLAKNRSQSQAFSLIVALMSIQLLFSFLFGTGQLWIADFAGFVVGFIISFFIIPGGIKGVLSILRS
jgi:membrane associated rhomboid family serine protease